MVIVIASLFSCNWEKRLYRNGYYANWNKNTEVHQEIKKEESKLVAESIEPKVKAGEETFSASINQAPKADAKPKALIQSKPKQHIGKSSAIHADKPLKPLKKQSDKPKEITDFERVMFITLGILLAFIALIAFLAGSPPLGIIFLVLALLFVLIGVCSDPVGLAILAALRLIYRGIVSLLTNKVW